MMEEMVRTSIIEAKADSIELESICKPAHSVSRTPYSMQFGTSKHGTYNIYNVAVDYRPLSNITNNIFRETITQSISAL